MLNMGNGSEIVICKVYKNLYESRIIFKLHTFSVEQAPLHVLQIKHNCIKQRTTSINYVMHFTGN